MIGYLTVDCIVPEANCVTISSPWCTDAGSVMIFPLHEVIEYPRRSVASGEMASRTCLMVSSLDRWRSIAAVTAVVMALPYSSILAWSGCMRRGHIVASDKVAAFRRRSARCIVPTGKKSQTGRSVNQKPP